MKKLILTLLILLAGSICWADGNNIQASYLLRDFWLPASATVKTGALDLNYYKPEGDYSLQIETSGTTGTVKTTYQLSNENVRAGGTFIDPSGVTDIITSHGVGNGMYEFEPMNSVWMQISFQETAGSGVTISAILAVK